MTDSLITALDDALAGFGISLVAATRLTFGASALKSLASMPAGSKLFVWCEGSTDAQKNIVKTITDANPNLAKHVSSLDCSNTSYAQVRSHVTNYAKSRKVAVVTTRPIKNDDDVNVGFALTLASK